MTKTVDEIREIVDRIEARQSSWVSLANEMEDMWALELWDNESDDTRRYVVNSTPHNTISTARRMINTLEPSVECPAIDYDGVSDEMQAMKERWLKAMWKQIRRDSQENVIGSVFWQALTLGKGVMQALWIKDALPRKQKNNRLPFLIRSLDPRLCGFERGPFYLQYAYYKPQMTNVAIKQQVPDYDYADEGEDQEKDVIEFWWIDSEDGSVWNAVVVDEKFIVEPMKTKYYTIPLVPVHGMFQPSKNEDTRYLSMLYPLRNGWESTSDIMTMVATSLYYHFLPPQPIVNEQGMAVNDEPMMPGEVRQFPPGTAFPNIMTTPNIPLASYALNTLQQDMQDGSFTGIANGQPLGRNEAGYSYNTAMAADESRIVEFVGNLQSAMSTVNEIVLHMVKTMSGKNGVTVFGRSVAEGGRYIIELTPEFVGDNFQNDVYLRPIMQRDEAAQVAMAVRMVDSGIISKNTMRDLYIDRELPDDEQQRIQLEAAMANPATAPIVALHTLQSYGSNSPAIQQLIEVLQAQVDAMMAQLQMAQQQTDMMSGNNMLPEQLLGGPPPAAQRPQQPPGPSVSEGALSAQQEGLPTDATFAAQSGEQLNPDDIAQLARGGLGNGNRI